MSKVCTRCKETKGIEFFSKNRTTSDGLQAMCKDCALSVQRGYRKTPKGKARDRRYEQSDKKKKVIGRYRGKDEVRLRINAQMREKRRDPIETEKGLIRRLLYNAFWDAKRKSPKTFKITGLNLKEYREYLIGTFVTRYGRHPTESDHLAIDHIVPLCTAKTKEEVWVLSVFSNLQLLLATDNNRKHIGTDVPSRTFEIK